MLQTIKGWWEAFCKRLHAALVANPFWKWNTFWIVLACVGSNMLLSLPETWLIAHPHVHWLSHQLIYVLALLYKFWTNTPVPLPQVKAPSDTQK